MAKFPQSDIISLTSVTPRYDLGESVGPDLRLGELFQGADLSALDDLALGYGTAAGGLELRQAVADGHGVEADDVIITVGGMHALFLTAFILCRPGAEVVTTTPLFPLARNALDTAGAKLRPLSLSFEQGYRLEPDRLGRRLSPRTRLVCLASPQNPSGVALAAAAIKEVLALMASMCPDAYLLLDETYREATYGDNPVAPSAVIESDKVISCASLSKCHGAPGLRIGWAITRDKTLREQLILGKFNTVISCSLVDEALALQVLRQRQRIIGERCQTLAAGLAKTAAWVETQARFVDWIKPDAGALCCVRLKPNAFDDSAVGRFYTALEAEGVRVAPGHWFGDEARVFRLGFGFLTLLDLDAALAGLTNALVNARAN